MPPSVKRESESMDASENATPKRRRFEALDEFAVVLGPKEEQKKFTISRAILTKSSAVLRAYCEKEWGLKEAKVIRLEDADVDTFSCYLAWLYTGKADISNWSYVAVDVNPFAPSEECSQARQVAASDRFETLLGYVFFAAEFEDAQFMNEIIKSIVTVLHDNRYIPSAAQVKAIYARLSAKSGVRRVVLDQFSHCQDPAKIQSAVLDYPPEFFFDIWATIGIRYAAKVVSKPTPSSCERYQRPASVGPARYPWQT